MSKKNNMSKQDEFQIQKMKYYINRYKQLKKSAQSHPSMSGGYFNLRGGANDVARRSNDNRCKGRNR